MVNKNAKDETPAKVEVDEVSPLKIEEVKSQADQLIEKLKLKCD